jgi:hypothetical protein
VITPLFVGVDDDFGVGFGLKMMASAFKLFAQNPEIINLSVENESDVAIFVVDRLIPAGEIDDAETANTKGDGGGERGAVDFAKTIGATMQHRGAHAMHGALSVLRIIDTDGAADSAHKTSMATQLHYSSNY